jgi:hypothetical protein
MTPAVGSGSEERRLKGFACLGIDASDSVQNKMVA